VMSHLRSIVASVVTAHALTSTGAVMAQTSLTIYNDGRVLVRRNVEANVPKGASQQRFTLGQIEPGSLVSLDPDVAVVGTTYDGDVSMDRALRRLVGREITVERPQPGGGYETFKVTVLGVDPFRFRLPDGSVAFDHPGGQLRFPEDVVTVTPTVAASLQSASAKKTVKLGWFTDGADWRAGYDVVLDKSQARIAGRAVLESSTLAVQDAEVQLLAGAVSRGRPEVTASPPHLEQLGRGLRIGLEPGGDVERGDVLGDLRRARRAEQSARDRRVAQGERDRQRGGRRVEAGRERPEPFARGERRGKRRIVER